VTSEQPSLGWRKATLSEGTGNCVEVARSGNRVWVRHSQQPLGPFLTFSRREWEVFLGGVKAHEFDFGDLPLVSTVS
jgi:predicted secreted Zn-dependent protease